MTQSNWPKHAAQPSGAGPVLLLQLAHDQGVSKIADLFEQSDQRHYYVPCPHCRHMQCWSGRT
ncbi:phage terminase large subunit family protein [Pseudomonas aeruginosa]